MTETALNSESILLLFQNLLKKKLELFQVLLKLTRQKKQLLATKTIAASNYKKLVEEQLKTQKEVTIIDQDLKQINELISQDPKPFFALPSFNSFDTEVTATQNALKLILNNLKTETQNSLLLATGIKAAIGDEIREIKQTKALKNSYQKQSKPHNVYGQLV